MEQITLDKTLKKEGSITYRYEVTAGLTKYFSERAFQIDYPESIEPVPDGIAAIPFVCNVLPIIWLTNSKLVVPELDEAFYHCIPQIRRGYETMYPESEFLGEIQVGKIVPCDKPAVPGKCAMFYSGGVDSMDTLFRHLEEKPALISIWGSDIRYDNVDGWMLLRKAIEEAAGRYQLPEAVIRSTFREFDQEGELNRSFGEQLQRNYWYGVKHSIGLLGHVAPYAYLNGLSVMYIASSNCPADGEIRCASDPRVDNYVRFAGCKVIHDGFACTRQDKVGNIVAYNRNQDKILPLHVCWETQTGKNCCWCEKCYRTMTGLVLEGADPSDYGFPDVEKSMPWMQEKIVLGGKAPRKTWGRLHKDVVERREQLKNSHHWKSIKWLLNADFEHPESLKMPLFWRVRYRASKTLPYRCLRRLRAMLHKPR